MCFSINCLTVICLPTVCYVFERETSSENYGPRGLLLSYYKNQKYLVAIYLLLFCFAIYLPIQDLIHASNELKGINNPLTRVGCKYLLSRFGENFVSR
jgi:hypothetical protein